MQCPACHNEVASESATFCNHCGAPLAAAPAAAASPVAAPVPPATASPASAYAAPPAAVSASTGLTPNSAAAISYITFIPAVLFLILEPYNKMPLVRFHSLQSIGLTVVWFALWIVVAAMSMFMAFIPGVRYLVFLFPLVHFVIFIGMFILWLVAIIKASKGEWFKLPILGDFALKQVQS